MSCRTTHAGIYIRLSLVQVQILVQHLNMHVLLATQALLITFILRAVSLKRNGKVCIQRAAALTVIISARNRWFNGTTALQIVNSKTACAVGLLSILGNEPPLLCL